MAAHDYYFKMGLEGLECNNNNLALVLERSQGSIRDDSTGELKLGDRFILEGNKNTEPAEVSPQYEFPFVNECASIYDAERFNQISDFKE